MTFMEYALKTLPILKGPMQVLFSVYPEITGKRPPLHSIS